MNGSQVSRKCEIISSDITTCGTLLVSLPGAQVLPSSRVQLLESPSESLLAGRSHGIIYRMVLHVTRRLLLQLLASVLSSRVRFQILDSKFSIFHCQRRLPWPTSQPEWLYCILSSVPCTSAKHQVSFLSVFCQSQTKPVLEISGSLLQW